MKRAKSLAKVDGARTGSGWIGRRPSHCCQSRPAISPLKVTQYSVQPELQWMGGITPGRWVAAMAKPYDMPVIPHGASVYNDHFVMANTNSPYAECLSVGKGEDIQPQAALDYSMFTASATTQRSIYVQAGGQPSHRAAWDDGFADALCGGFFSGTRATQEEAIVRPRYSGYVALQTDGGNALQEHLRDGRSLAGTLDQLDTLYRESRLRGGKDYQTQVLGLTLDYAHFTRGGIPDGRIEPLLAHATHLHARCARRGRLQCPLRENSIDFPRIVDGLARRRFKGWIALEYVWIDWEHSF